MTTATAALTATAGTGNTLPGLIAAANSGEAFETALAGMELEGLDPARRAAIFDDEGLHYALHMTSPDFAEAYALQMRIHERPLLGDDREKLRNSQTTLAEIFRHLGEAWTHFQGTFLNRHAQPRMFGEQAGLLPADLNGFSGRKRAALRMGRELGHKIFFLSDTLLHQEGRTPALMLVGLFPFLRSMEALAMDAQTEASFRHGLQSVLKEKMPATVKEAFSIAKALYLSIFLKIEAPLFWEHHGFTLSQQKSFEAFLVKLADIFAGLERMSQNEKSPAEVAKLEPFLKDLQAFIVRLKTLLKQMEWDIFFARLEEHSLQPHRRTTGMIRTMLGRVEEAKQKLK